MLQMCCRQTVLLALVLVTLYVATEARYLPTRSQDDRLDKLRELLRDVSNVSYVACCSYKTEPRRAGILPQ
jgi:hypothetical protein